MVLPQLSPKKVTEQKIFNYYQFVYVPINLIQRVLILVLTN